MNSSHLILSVLSILFFVIGLRGYSLQRETSGNVLKCIVAVYAFSYLFYTLFYAVCYYFTGKGINYAVLYHIKYGIDGAGYWEYKKLIFTVFFVLLVLFSLECYFLFSGASTGSPNKTFLFMDE